MSTPKQDTRTIETPFGTAKVVDTRYYSDHQDTRPRLASIAFEDGLTVNRKEYTGVHFELQRGYTSEEPYYVSPTGYNYRELTDSARAKVGEWFALPENRELYTPYLEELDADDIKRQIKSSLRHKIGRAFYDAEGNREFPEGSKPLLKELLTEILTEALEYTKGTKSFTDYYFDKD